MIAARLGNEATVKTLTHRGPTIVLEPANPAERSIDVSPRDDFAVLGVVCGIFRPFFEQEVVRVDHGMSPEDLVHMGRDVESLVLARAVKWHVEHRILLNGSRTVVFK